MTMQPSSYPPDASSVESQELVEAMNDGFAVWQDGLLWTNHVGQTISAGPPVREYNKRVYAHPTVEGGLPEDWDLLWMSEQSGAYVSAVTQPHHLCVAHRRAGGWALVIHRTKKHAGHPETNLWIRGYPTAADLYAGALFSARPGPDPAVEEMRQFMLSSYDMTDPAEAAEATLIGLGAPLTVLPRSLT